MTIRFHKTSTGEKSEFSDKLLGDLVEKDKGLQYLEVLFRHLVQGTDKLSSQDFERALSNIPEGGAIMSNLAEQWFHEGERKRAVGRPVRRREERPDGRQTPRGL
jgi:hypothetical protein